MTHCRQKGSGPDEAGPSNIFIDGGEVENLMVNINES
jgi:hypothetical protein